MRRRKCARLQISCEEGGKIMQILFGYLQILKSLMVTSSIKGRSLLASKKYTKVLSGHSLFSAQFSMYDP